jgi:hypothetical protein
MNQFEHGLKYEINTDVLKQELLYRTANKKKNHSLNIHHV